MCAMVTSYSGISCHCTVHGDIQIMLPKEENLLRKYQVTGFIILVVNILLLGLDLLNGSNKLFALLSALFSLSTVVWFIYYNKKAREFSNK